MSWIMDIYKYLRLIRFLLFSTTMYTFVTSFEEVPSSLIVSPGTEATFRCRHRRADIIGWLVNGTSIGQIINSDITPGTIRYDGGILVHTLTIVASPEYDNSEVECVASFVHQQFPPTLSPVVTLTVLEGLNMTSYEGFIRVPSSFNVTEGSGFAFTCHHARTKAIEWCINGTLRFDDNFPPNVTATVLSLPSRETVHSLQIHQPAANLNGAIIQCAAFIELQPEKSLPAVVLVQGPLQSVASISRNTTTISWDEPFSLDLAGVDPDIVYCVEVFNITCGRRALIISDCNVTEPSYTSDDIAPDGYIYEYIITPRSNVEGARNGSNSAVIEQFVCFNESARGWRVSIVNKSLTNVTLNVNVYLKKQDAVKPTAFSAVFNSVDGVQDFDGFTMPVAITPSGNDSSVDIILEVPFRRVLDTTVLAYDCKEHPLTDAIELGTHDVYDISVSSPVPDVIMITGYVIFGSTSRGILAVVYSDFNISYYYVPHNSTQPGVYSVGVKLPDNQYQVSVFVVEESRQPLPRAAARPKSVFIIGSSEVKKESSPIKYELFPTSTGVCITCTFLDSSTTDCVAVVHQRISQLSSSGLMNIEASHKFSRSASGDTAYGCIDGVDLELYQVGVVGGKMIVESDIIDKESSQAGAITAVLVGVTTVATLITVIIVIVYIYLKIHARHKAWSTALEVPEVGITRPWPPNSIMNNNIESGSVNYNHYVEPAILKEEEAERPAEEQPLLNPPLPPRQGAGRVVADHTPVSSGDSPQLNHGSSDNSSSSDPQAVLIRSSKTVPPPATTEKLVYEDIQGFLNQQGQLYALPQLKSTSKEAPDDLHQVVYSKLQLPPKTRSEMSSTEPHEVQRTVPSEAPSTESNSEQAASEVLTVELLLSRLSPHTSKWLSLGKALSLGDDRLDEVFTNNETDQACLQEMLELYMMRSDLNHNWEEIETALKKMEKSSEASSGIQESQRDSSNESLMISGLTNFPSNSCANTQGVHLPESTAILDQSGDSFGVEQPDKQGSKNAEKDDSSSDDSGYNSRSPPLSELEFNNEHTSSQNEKVSGELPLLPCLLATSARHGDMTAFNSNIAIDIDATELDDYQSDLNSLTGSEATIQGGDDGGGEFNRTTEKNENKRPDKPMISLPVSSCSSTEQNLYVHTVGFLEKNDGQDNEEELCKLGPIHCQDSHDHKNYFTALRHQMGFQTVPKAIDNNAVEESSHGCTECPSSETQKLIISEKEWELAPQLSHAWNCLGVNQGSVSSSLSLNQNSKCRSEEDSLSYQSSGIVPALKCSNRSIIPLAVEAFDYLQSQEHDEHPTSSNKLQTFADSSHTVFDSDVITIICTGVYSKYSPQWQNSLITIHLPSDHLIILFLLAYVMLCIPYLSKSFVTTNVCSGNVCTH